MAMESNQLLSIPLFEHHGTTSFLEVTKEVSECPSSLQLEEFLVFVLCSSFCSSFLSTNQPRYFGVQGRITGGEIKHLSPGSLSHGREFN
jgi:hypothetical protein